MDAITQILLATIGVSLISLIGIFVTKNVRKPYMHMLVSFACGALLGASFLHIIPEGAESGHAFFYFLIGGFLLFFILEKFIYWYHCHEGTCKEHPVTYLSLLGDALHNFTDGMIIAAAFLADQTLGITTTIAIALHEIPQELGDYAILVHGGFTRTKALIANLASALFAVLGALLTVTVLQGLPEFSAHALGIAAGGFVYIAASDLVPEIHKITDRKESLLHFIVMLLGIALMGWLSMQFHV